MTSTTALYVFCLAIHLALSENVSFIKHGFYNNQTKSMEFEIIQNHGCMDDRFKLDIGGCFETYPVQCEGVELFVIPGKSNCKNSVHRQVSISLHEAGLDIDYYEGGLFIINDATGSKVSIELPRSNRLSFFAQNKDV